MKRRDIACPGCKSTRIGLITLAGRYALRCVSCTLTRPI